MASSKKFAMGAAGAAGGDALNVEDVFSVDILDGSEEATYPTTPIVNGIDVAGEGALIWTKATTSSSFDHHIFDNERPYNYSNIMSKALMPNRALKETSWGFTVAANNNGWTPSFATALYGDTQDYIYYTFRKAPKFFDMVTYSGNGTAGRTVSHNLGSTPGCIIVKCLGVNTEWFIYHRGAAATPHNVALRFDDTTGISNGALWNYTAPTSTQFTLGSSANVNGSGRDYIAYIFAHNDGDGEFGPTGDQDIIKCGSVSYTTTGGATVDLGFEPQWVLVKPTDVAGNWFIHDEIRGMYYGTRGPKHDVDNSNPQSNNAGVVYPTATGFEVPASIYNNTNLTYIAIRRGPMAVPTDSSEVFAIDTSSSGVPWFNTSFKVDSALVGQVTGTDKWYWSNRKTDDKYINTTSSSTGSSPAFGGFYYNTGFYSGNLSSDYQAWMWARATGFFDVVSYTGNGTHSTEIKHNLGAAPEMIIFKNLTYTYDKPTLWNKWYAYNPSIPNNSIGSHWDMGSTLRTPLSNVDVLNSNNASSQNNFEPTDTSFWVGNDRRSNRNGDTILALVFASLDGVSKVGTYVGNSNNTSSGSQTIDCGFSNGTKFVFIKPVGGSYNIPWMIFDTTRGINTGSDNMLQFQSNSVERTWYDWIDQDSSGFVANNFGDASYNLNTNNTKYMFYAVAA